MKTGAILLWLSLNAIAAESTEPVAESKRALPGSTVRGRITELVKQDAAKISPAQPEGAAASTDAETAVGDQPVAEGVLQLDPFTITKKRDVVLPPIPRLTLENFFYGDGTIARKGRVSLSAGPEGKGLAAIKFNIKF